MAAGEERSETRVVQKGSGGQRGSDQGRPRARAFHRATPVSGLVIGHAAGAGQRGEAVSVPAIHHSAALFIFLSYTHTHTFNHPNVLRIPPSHLLRAPESLK